MNSGRTWLAALVVGLCLAACGGSAPTEQSGIPTTPPVVGTVTVSMTACTLDTAGVPIRAGDIMLIVLNKTDLEVDLDMAMIEEGYTFAELASDIEKARLSAEAGGPVIIRPSYLGRRIEVSLGPGKSGVLTGTVSPGTYGIVCLRRYEGLGQRPFAVAGPLEVN